MNWTSVSDFLAMGGYALYVWGAYAVTVACMLAEPILAGRRHRRALDGEMGEAMFGETVLDGSR